MEGRFRKESPTLVENKMSVTTFNRLSKCESYIVGVLF